MPRPLISVRARSSSTAAVMLVERKQAIYFDGKVTIGPQMSWLNVSASAQVPSQASHYPRSQCAWTAACQHLAKQLTLVPVRINAALAALKHPNCCERSTVGLRCSCPTAHPRVH
jgi:hypothetical protein